MAKKIDTEAAPDLSTHQAPGIVTFSAQELANMDDSEREIAEHMNRLAAEGIDPTLDDEEIAAIRAQRAADGERAAKEIADQPDPNLDKKADGDDTKNQPQDSGADQGQQQPTEQNQPAQQQEGQIENQEAADEPMLLPVGDIAALNAERKELRQKERALQKAWVDGELDQEAYDAQLAELQDKIDDVTTNIGASRAIQQQNELTQIRHQQATINAIRTRGAEIGLDYKSQPIAAAFDTAMDLVASQPANAALTFAQLAEKAHAMVAAMHGITAKAPAPAPAPAVARQPPPVPRTIGKLPAAEIPNQGSQAQDLGEQLFAGKTAAEAEAAWENLTPAQKKALLGDYA